MFDSASDGRGLFLHFINFNSSDEARTRALGVYLRATYRLYPQRILATDSGVRVSTGQQMLDANFDPDSGWLLQHGMDRELTMGWEPSSEGIDYSVQSVGPGK